MGEQRAVKAGVPGRGKCRRQVGTLSSLASPSQSISWGELSEASVVTLAFQAANLSPPERGEDSGPSRCLITPSPQAGGDPEDPGAVGEPWVSRPVRNGVVVVGSPGAADGSVSPGGRGVAATGAMVRAALHQCGTRAAGGPGGGARRAPASGSQLLSV